MSFKSEKKEERVFTGFRGGNKKHPRREGGFKREYEKGHNKKHGPRKTEGEGQEEKREGKPFRPRRNYNREGENVQRDPEFRNQRDSRNRNYHKDGDRRPQYKPRENREQENKTQEE